MRTRHIPVLLLLCLSLSATAVAAEKVGIGLRVGTQGWGAEVGFKLSDRFGLRAGLYGAEISDSYEETDIVYDGDLQLGGLGVIADFHPFRGGFHLSAGLLSNETGIDMSATPTMSQTIGGNVYTPAEIGTLTGSVDFDDTAPYFGLGWGRIPGSGRVGFLADIGVLAQGSGSVSLTSSTGLINPADLQAEIDEIEADIEDFDLWPVISFGLAIRF